MSSSAATKLPPAPRISARVVKKIHETIDVSPVTIVVGPTGCGKSTQVPSALLLRYRDGPILCTQPRRLAVVAVATRVAQELGVTLGGADVGYHVGQSNHSLTSTKLIFTTAGILLENLRADGVAALIKYKVIIIDECHERSQESDLVLALLRSMLLTNPNKGIRIVLMSATFDHARYQRYFAHVPGCDRIQTITLETASSFDDFHERVETFYLDDIIAMLPPSVTLTKLRITMKMDPNADLAGDDNGKTLSPGLLILIRELILNRHRKEPTDGVFVIFAPTYRHLEQIYELLRYQTSAVTNWRIGVLHSSVDIEYCLRSMRSDFSDDGAGGVPHRKILLASAIADSSVTIPGVTCVVDLCRSLEVRWNTQTKMHIARTVWASHSICDQRRGRTGRTCPGKVYRLVPKGFYVSNLPSWEISQLSLSSCRDEVLKILCAASVRDPSELFEQCLDPPTTSVIQDAMLYLKSIGACVNSKKRLIPTRSGTLMAMLPFHVEDSKIILDGGRLGLMHETLVLRAISSHKPAPIAHQFGDNARNEANAMQFYSKFQVGDPTSLGVANLSAFLYWDALWNGSRTKATLEQFAHATGARSFIQESFVKFLNGQSDSRKACCDVWRWTPQLEEQHLKFCESNDINPTSVRAIADLVESTWHVFYLSKFEPEWLRCVHPTPVWRRRESWVNKAGNNAMEMISNVYGADKCQDLVQALTSLSNSQIDIASHHATNFVIKKVATPQAQALNNPVACVHFLLGNCTYGNHCRHSHSPFALPPKCRYFQSGRCVKGADCVYSHEDDKPLRNAIAGIDNNSLGALIPSLPNLSMFDGTVKWFSDSRRKLLLLGEGNFEFTRSLMKLGLNPAFASDLETDLYEIGSTEVFSVDASRIHLNDDIWELVASGRIESFAWNFPFTGIEENVGIHESLILGTFYSLNELLLTRTRGVKQFRLAFTLQGDQFSRWMVMRSAVRSGWQLESWGPFHASDYPGYNPRRVNGDVFPESSSRFYVFTNNVSD
jgi:HrpA-like RNA helicase